MYELIKSILFLLDPEISHDLTLHTLKWLKSNPVAKPRFWHPVACMGLDFPNPIGLAAGLDKNAIALGAWERLGFGFVEVGTVTPRAQPGNAKPRLFRLKEDQAIINRMGFNNKGVDFLIQQIQQNLIHCPIGVNIGKNRDTSLEKAGDDYLEAFQKVYPYADYITINLSSPNTPGLRSLQQGDLLKSILLPLKNAQVQMTTHLRKHVPIVVKISPDLEQQELKSIVMSLMECEIEGIIATNTTIKRPLSLKSPFKNEDGGLSGAPVFDAATQAVRTIYAITQGKLPIIAVGGIMNAEQAKAKLAAGANLVQLYSGFIYRGPKLISEISKILRSS